MSNKPLIVDANGRTVELSSGDLALPADPTTALAAATKQYVDARGAANIVAGTNISIDKTNPLAPVIGLTPTLLSDDSSFTVGSSFVQRGTGTCAASGTHTASTTITFPVAFESAPVVTAQVTSPGSAAGSYLVIAVPSDISDTGCTLNFNTNSSDGDNGNITGDITYNWTAEGTGSGSGGSPSDSIPSSIPDLLFWFDSDFANISDGNTIGSLYNKCQWLPQHANAINSTSAGQVKVNNSSLNGRSTVKFSASGETGYSITSSNAGSAYTIFVVFKPYSISSVQTFVAGANGTSLQFRIESNGALGLIQSDTANIGNTSAGLISSGVWYKSSVTYDSSSGNYAFRINGSNILSGSNIKSITTAPVNIGAHISSGSPVEFLDSEIASIIFFNRVLNSDEITKVESYFSSKWGV